jgi:hypothetical protein
MHSRTELQSLRRIAIGHGLGDALWALLHHAQHLIGILPSDRVEQPEQRAATREQHCAQEGKEDLA